HEAAFDHAKLAAGLSKAAESEFQAKKPPFDSIEFVEDEKALQFKVGSTTWKCDLATYECTRNERSSRDDPNRFLSATSVSAGDDEEAATQSEEVAPQEGAQPQRLRDSPSSDSSPDGKWSAFIKDSNVFLHSQDENKDLQLTRDGKDGFAYGMLKWSPDSQSL